MTHPSKRKGNTFEREIVNLLRDYGIDAKRVPLSGAMSGYEGDLRVPIGGLERRAECKRRARAFATLHAMLGANELLFVRDDRSEPMVVMGIAEFCGFVRELDYYKTAYLNGKFHGNTIAEPELYVGSERGQDHVGLPRGGTFSRQDCAGTIAAPGQDVYPLPDHRPLASSGPISGEAGMPGRQKRNGEKS